MEALRMTLSIWLGLIGACLGGIGWMGKHVFGWLEGFGADIIEYSLRYDDF